VLKVADPILQLESGIEQLLDALHKTSVLLEEFRPENQGRLQDGVSRLPAQLDAVAVAASSNQVRALSVPRQLFDFLDSGTNPDLLTKQLIERAVAESELCKGKVVALADYHAQLHAEAVNAFPELKAVLGVDAATDRREDNTKRVKLGGEQ
jgi:hypothetical protein